ncbi:MAG: adenosylmethionine--8-amino-7-oxononanoate transaminase [Alphaproteobacteria bacterium]|nr:adenosylmethionine--8-amino-7-oxononanoate transaminase [Alphaproteobacteria bacterium]
MQTEPAPWKAVRTEGTRIHLEDGRTLLDGIASWWTACHGYNHPHIVAAMEAQLRAMPHVMFGGLTHEPALALADRLAAVLPGAGTEAALGHVFFCDSGSVAVEVAMKMAVQYWRNRGEAARNRGEAARNRFVCFRFGYHGDTMGAMSVCDPIEGMHALFRGYFPEQVLADIPRTAEARAAFESLLARHRDEAAAVIVEPMLQAAGGMKLHDADTLRFVAEAARRHGMLFIADEIATGFGRTGRMFACDHAGVVPDIVCIGKAMTGGAIGMAATAASAAVFDAFLSDDASRALMHGPSYMANPLGCAAALAALDLFADGTTVARAAAMEAEIAAGLAPCRDILGVRDVRAFGAMGAVQLESPRDFPWMKDRFVERGVWLRPFGDVVYLMPPLIATPEEVAVLTGAIVDVLREREGRND